MTTLFTQGTSTRVAASGTNLILVTLAAGTFSLLLFQGVHPVALTISLSMAQESCALNAGSPNGFLMGPVWAGGAPLPAPPLGVPLLPPPLPCSGSLGNMVAGSMRPLEGMLRYTDLDSTTG